MLNFIKLYILPKNFLLFFIQFNHKFFLFILEIIFFTIIKSNIFFYTKEQFKFAYIMMNLIIMIIIF